MLVLERTAPVRELIAPLPDPTERTAVVLRPLDAAVVLGSTQPENDVDADAAAKAGLEVLRRRSGGGAVFVAPDAQWWVDLFVPADDPLFDRDVSRAAYPVGEAWSEALAGSGLPGVALQVSRGALRDAPFARQLCFLGLGPGEVTCAGRKVVGLAQRRNRAGAWFFVMAPLVINPARQASVLGVPPDQQLAAAAALSVGVQVAPADAAFEGRLLELLERA